MRTQAGTGYRPELDGLRGLAILLVLNQHFKVPTPEPGSFVGVDIFFVLSGYLITSLLVKEWSANGRVSFPRFYARRALRLLPAAALFILVSLVTTRLGAGPEAQAQNLSGAGYTALYITNWALALLPHAELGDFDITWSLAIEEQFYLLWPVLLTAMLARWKRVNIGVALAIAVGAVFAWRFIQWQHGATTARLYYGSDTRADTLLFGCLVAVAMPTIAERVARSPSLRAGVRAAAAVAVLFLVWVIHTKDTNASFLYLGGMTLVAMAGAVVLIATTTAAPPPVLAILRFRPLVWIGRISYGLYLWHWLVYRHARHLSASPKRAAWIGVLVSLAVAAVSYHVIEAPFLRLKGRVRARGVEPSAARAGQV